MNGVNVTDVVLSNGMKSIKRAQFADYDGLENIYVPDSVIQVDDYAFSHCTSLKSIELGELQKLGSYAFDGCEGLESVRLKAVPKQIGIEPFRGCVSLQYIEVDGHIDLVGAGLDWIPKGVRLVCKEVCAYE